MSPFQGLDRALLWLRIEANRKQGEVAKAARLTPAMLCSFEKGKRVPSLVSLQKVLLALDADTHDLARALDAVNHRLRAEPTAGSGRPAAVAVESAREPAAVELRRLLDELAVSLRHAGDTLGALSEKKLSSRDEETDRK